VDWVRWVGGLFSWLLAAGCAETAFTVSLTTPSHHNPNPTPPLSTPHHTDTVFLDGWRQAVALTSGEVIAVRSGQQSVATFFGCHDKQVYTDPQELHRPVLASILSAGWGVSDTALFWSEATGRSWSYLWSLGPTPFGPLSSSTTLSFSQRDAMVRNMALASINASVGHVVALLEGFIKIGGPDAMVKSFLAPDQVCMTRLRGCWVCTAGTTSVDPSMCTAVTTTIPTTPQSNRLYPTTSALRCCCSSFKRRWPLSAVSTMLQHLVLPPA